MRVMLDTNVLISVIIFKSKVMTDMMSIVLTKHRLVLSSYVIEELKQVVARKFEGKSRALEEFLSALPYDFVYTPDLMDQELFTIRDPADLSSHLPSSYKNLAHSASVKKSLGSISVNEVLFFMPKRRSI